MEDSLASMATSNKSEQVQMQISTAILNQIQDQQKTQGSMLVQMINGMSLDGTGQIVNKAA
jgi:hypothetical protein